MFEDGTVRIVDRFTEFRSICCFTNIIGQEEGPGEAAGRGVRQSGEGGESPEDSPRHREHLRVWRLQ